MFKLIPRSPQPRKRKVSVYDLVKALEQALEVKKRRVLRSAPSLTLRLPSKMFDVGEAIHEVFDRIKAYFEKQNTQKMKFSQISPSDNKEDKVYTLIPLLHLTNMRKIDLEQDAPFSDFDILLLNKEKPSTKNIDLA